MKETALGCFSDFICLAGRCPDTCCIGWQVDLDERAVAIYKTLPGELGGEVRKNMKTQDGCTFFEMEGDRCPFLNERNLCRLILAHGDEVLSETCREHPRFREEYGDTLEHCLSISCPEAARLLLEKPFSISTVETAGFPGQPLSEGESRVFSHLLEYRRQLFMIARCNRPFMERLGIIWFAAEPEQRTLEFLEAAPKPDKESIIGTFVYRKPLSEARQAQTLLHHYAQLPAPDWSPKLKAFLQTMTGMEFTREELNTMLEQALKSEETALLSAVEGHSAAAEKILCYFLYRYVPRAVWSLSLMDKVRFAVASTLAILALCPFARGGSEEERLLNTAVVYSREVEHSDENLALLYDWLWG